MTAAETSAPTVTEVLAAIDRAALLPLVPSEEGRLLAGPVARVAAGVTLPIEDQRAAARALQAARPWLEGPLASLGLSIPAPPEPVVHHPVSEQVQRAPMAKLVEGGQRVGVRNVFDVMSLVKALPGARPVPRGNWHVYTVPATPGGAHNLVTTLEPFGMRLNTRDEHGELRRDGTVTPGVQRLYEAYEAGQDARRFLADGAPLPDHDESTYGLHMSAWAHQKRAIAYGEASPGMVLAAPMGPQPVDTPVLTPKGWRALGDFVPGDEVYGVDGRPVRIRDVRHYGEVPVYRVTLSDGTSTRCTAEHRWEVASPRDRRTGRSRVHTTAELMADKLTVGIKGKGYRWTLPVQPVVEMSGADGLPVPAYLLGAYIANGSASASGSPELAVSDADTLARVLVDAELLGLQARVRDRGTWTRVSLVGGAVGQVRRNPLTGALRELGLHLVGAREKFIPESYLCAEQEVRLTLLRGLMDGDGSATLVCGGAASYSTMSARLAEDVALLARSLGFVVRVRHGGPQHGWEVLLRGAGINPFHCPRKADRFARPNRSARRRAITGITPDGVAAVCCIELDVSENASTVYLTDTALIPTCNSGKTATFIALVNRIQASTVMVVCPNRVRGVWRREVRERSRVSWHIVDGTREALRRGGRRQDLPHPERVAEADRVFFDCGCGAPVHAVVLNYEALSQRAWQQWVPAEKLDVLLYDEGHRLANYRLKVPPPKASHGPREKEVRSKIAAAKRRATRGVDDLETRELIEGADALIKEAKVVDSMGERERTLRRECGEEEPPLRELNVARTLDRIEAKRQAEFQSSKLTVSGVAAKWVEWSHHRWAATGTPFKQNPWDVFGLYRAIDPAVFGSVWTPFRDKFIELDRTGTYPKKIHPHMLSEFANLSMSLMYRPVVDLNLPGCSDVVREVELEDDARTVYDQLDTELWADLSPYVARSGPVPADLEGPAEITAHNVLSRLLRLQQLTGGTLRTDAVEDSRGYVIDGPQARVSTAKTDALDGILEEIGCVPGREDAAGEPVAPEPVIVFCRFRSDLDAVKAVATKAGLRYGEISGRRGDGLNADARMATDKDLVAVQIQAGGTGVDLTRARYGIWYSLGYSVSDYDQARARLYRPGQTRPVVYIHLIAAETADGQVYRAIKARKAAVAAVLRAGGVDPSELGLDEADPGPDPTSEPVEGVDASASAVELPWEKPEGRP